MKKKLLLVSAFCICLSFAASDCSNDNASPTSPNNSIGVISYTDDGGDTWASRNVALAGDVTAICSFPEDIDTFCIIIKYPESQEILKTTNSGNNFVTVFTHAGIINDITGMMTDGKGFAAGSSGLLLVTTNYGSNWTEINTGTAASLRSIDFSNETNGIIIGESNILTTTNGGANWVIRPNIPDLNSVSYISSFPRSEAIACGNSGKIYRTVNNGENWIQINSPLNDNLVSVDFIDPVGIIAGPVNHVLRSTDRGLNWYEVPVPQQGLVFKTYTESLYYWTISVVNILRSPDQGETWTSVRPAGISLNDGIFSKNRGVIVGNRIP